MVTLYERLSSLCEEKGIKGGRMCTELGFSKSLMTDLKNGRKKSVNAETAQKIASYFGVSVGYLLGEEETPAIRDSRSSGDITFDDFTYAMYNESKKLSTEDKEMLLAFARRLRERVESESKQTGEGEQ